MKQQLFAIKDTALNSFLQVFQAPTTGAANRAFADGVNDNQTPMNKHPEDYELYELGTWDQDSGLIEPQTPKMIARARDVITK